MTGRLRALLVLVVAVLGSAVGCSAAGDPVAGSAVAISQTVGPARSPSSSPTSTSTSPVGSSVSVSDLPANPETGQTPAAPSLDPPSTDPSTTARSTESAAATTVGTPPPTTRPGTSAPAASAAGPVTGDPDVPGPESGPRCKADPQYVDEATTGLAPVVITAWNRAKAKAKSAGVTMCVNDGKRSRAQQQAQYDAYVQKYGKEVADQLVLPPNKSAHVQGIAVDVQPAEAYQWLQATRGSLGFCRRYDNEAWHFEYDPTYATDGCPVRLPKPDR